MLTSVHVHVYVSTVPELSGSYDPDESRIMSADEPTVYSGCPRMTATGSRLAIVVVVVTVLVTVVSSSHITVTEEKQVEDQNETEMTYSANHQFYINISTENISGLQLVI